MPTIVYYHTLISPFTWLGHQRLVDLAAQSGATVEVRPFNILKVFEATDTTPPIRQAEARQAYRRRDLQRWAGRLGVPLNMPPKFFPVPMDPASALVIAAREQGLDALRLSGACLRAVWAEERDISDPATLAAIAAAEGFDAEALTAAAASPDIQALVTAETESAIAAGVIGSPFYIVNGEPFFGQDRLDWVAEALAQ